MCLLKKREYRRVIEAPESCVLVELLHRYAPEYCPSGRDARARSSSKESPWEFGKRSPEDFGRCPVHPPIDTNPGWFAQQSLGLDRRKDALRRDRERRPRCT